MKFLPTIKGNLFTLLFIVGEMKWNFVSGVIKYYCHIFEIPSISNKKPSISIGNFGFRSKNSVFQINNFEIPGFSLIEIEILGILSEILNFSKKVWNTKFFTGNTTYFKNMGNCIP